MARVRLAGALASVPLLALLACGKQGDPLPPLRRTPNPVQALRVAQRGDQLEVAYQAPGVSIDGVRLPVLQMEVLMMQGEGDFEKLATRRTRKAEPGERVADLVPAPPPGTTVRVAVRALARSRASVRTPVAGLVAQAPPAAPSALTAELVPTGVALAWKGARPDPVKAALPTPTPTPLAGLPGALGTRPSIPGAQAPALAAPPGPSGPAPPGSPVPAPAGPGPAAAPAVPGPASGVAAPAGTAPGRTVTAEDAALAAPPFPGGFSVYRRAKDGVYTIPLATPTDGTSFADTTAPLGQSFCYVVRAVASLEPIVESASSQEACVAVADIAPPATPAGLSSLAVAEGIELTWSPSTEADLAGYRILRSAPGGAAEPIGDVAPKETQFLDKGAVRGLRYRYRIVAFDQAGNASPPSEPAEGELR